MAKRVLLVSAASPYPVVTDGCQRLVSDYQTRRSFCFTDTHPHPDVPDGLFRGILSHRISDPHRDLLLVGGSYDDEVFCSDRKSEELVLTVGRICPYKNQLELASHYREAIFEEYGLIACGATCVVNGDDRGFAEADLRPNVYGKVTAKRGSVIDLVAQALRDNVRIDGSEWARKYSLREIRAVVRQFIHERL
ncbi:MAG: hypothetical protein ACRD0K_10790 [Egibacteraceae bacterium]